MLCLLWDPCALSSQEEAHQEQLVLLGLLVLLLLLLLLVYQFTGLEDGLSQVVSLVTLL